MKLDKSFFRSKLAQRIFLMFVACALLPIAGLFVLSFTQVTKQLYQQSHKRLKQSAKSHGLSLYERLLFLDAEMQAFVSILDSETSTNVDKLVDPELKNRFAGRFNGLFLYRAQEIYRSFFGGVEELPEFSSAQIQHAAAGKPAILTKYSSKALPSIFILRRLSKKTENAVFLIGEVNPSYLWGVDHENMLPYGVDVCVLDESKHLLFSSFPDQMALFARASPRIRSSTPDLSELMIGDDRYLASRWTMFLKPKFLVRDWTVVLLQSEAAVFAPLANFKKMFILIILMTLWIVLLLSIRFIRRSLGPLELLKEGTQRIARRDFEGQVQIDSKDEFEELAEAFNQMSNRLSRQFKTLVTKAEIDRAVLSSLRTESIVKTVITRMQACFSYDAISIGLIDSKLDDTIHVYSGTDLQGSFINHTSAALTSDDVQTLDENPEYLYLDDQQTLPAYLSPLTARGIRSFLILPVFLKGKLSAVLAFGHFNQKKPNEEEYPLARQMADQVAVALSNSKLIEELNQLTWGTLKALARAVDAKSSWTAGHSERVATLSLQIGRALQLDSKALENLHRAALLHDIGKLGVPVAILDKPGALSNEEHRIIKSHPGLGARILEPINAYAEIIPMVKQHHERFDGKGYPDSLFGEEIDLGARILAVADVFDALKSDRPYRNGWSLERVIELIKKEAGHQFDSQVVAAFLTTIALNGAKAA